MARFVNADGFLNLFHAVMESKGLSDTDSWFSYRDLERVISATQTADVREVIEADGYTHLICPHCLSEFYAKTKAEMFCPSCGKKIFFSEKWESYDMRGDE